MGVPHSTLTGQTGSESRDELSVCRCHLLSGLWPAEISMKSWRHVLMYFGHWGPNSFGEQEDGLHKDHKIFCCIRICKVFFSFFFFFPSLPFPFFFFLLYLWDPIQAPPPSLWPGRTCNFVFHRSTVRQPTEWPGILLWTIADRKREVQQATLAICQWFSINSACPQHGSLLSQPHCCCPCTAHCDHEETGQGLSTFLSPKFDVFSFVCLFVCVVSGTL